MSAAGKVMSGQREEDGQQEGKPASERASQRAARRNLGCGPEAGWIQCQTGGWGVQKGSGRVATGLVGSGRIRQSAWRGVRDWSVPAPRRVAASLILFPRNAPMPGFPMPPSTLAKSASVGSLPKHLLAWRPKRSTGVTPCALISAQMAVLHSDPPYPGTPTRTRSLSREPLAQNARLLFRDHVPPEQDQAATQEMVNA
jgi:hypothetical protein